MSRRFIRWVALGSVVVLLAGGAGVAAAEPTPPPPTAVTPGADPTPPPTEEALGADLAPIGGAEAYSDELPNPLEADRRDLRDRALQEVIAGTREVETRNGSKVVRVGASEAPQAEAERGRLRQGRPEPPPSAERYVEVGRERSDRVFVLLVDFGDERQASYPDTDTNPGIPGPAVFDGPRQNTIPAPDRRLDNTTIWRQDFSREYYQDLYFGRGSQSLKSYYERQSSGRYSIEGEVSDWVTVRYNQARYGRSNGFPCAAEVCSNSWYLVRDAMNAWFAQQRAAGRSDQEIQATLARYDVWDRYNLDNDKIFNEPDGYLDHLQIVHAGGDQATGDQYFGEDAIWSHRWRAFQRGEVGPGPPATPIGGTEVGTTGIWAADYTMQAENAGMAVFAHEYGHDLGLPDHYDTTDPSRDNPVNWWSLMGQSRVKARRDVGVGTRAADLSAWDKLTLGWLDHTVVDARQPKTVDLGPHEYASGKPQAVLVNLPGKVTPTPTSGRRQWWSGTGNGYASGLARFVDIPAASTVKLRFQANYSIEDCGAVACDYAYVEVGTGTGADLRFSPIPGTITKPREGNGIDGSSEGWVPAEFDLSAYAGQEVALRFRYATNATNQGAKAGAAAGLFVDDIDLTADGKPLITEDSESPDDTWFPLGFSNVDASTVDTTPHYYLASYRADLSYDRYLKSGPYNLGWPATKPQLVEFFPYQHGLLVSYWDTAYNDNNTSLHPGRGRILPIDARPRPLRTGSGVPWRGRIQTYDAPFSLRPSDPLVLHADGRQTFVRGGRAEPLFDDTRTFASAELPEIGVQTPKVGLTLRVTAQTASTMRVRVGVVPGTAAAASAER